MKHKILSVQMKSFLLVLSGLFLFNLTGCGTTTEESLINYNNSETITFAWWGNDARHFYTMDAVDIFQENNPDINVKCNYGSWKGYPKRMNIYMNSHSEPDVMQINFAWINTYSPDGNAFYDLNELSDYIDLSNFDETDLEFGMSNGKLNAIPIAFNTLTMYYNKSIYDSYNLDLPTTWDDFFEAAEVMREDNIYPLGVSEKGLFMLLCAYHTQTTGKDVFDEEGNWNLSEEDIVSMLSFYKQLIDEKALQRLDDFQRTAFLSGETAGTMQWVSDASNYCTSLSETGAEIAIGSYPMEEGATSLGWYMKPATMYAISSLTEHPEASAKLLDFLLNSDDMALLQQTEKGIPVSKHALKVLEDNDLLDGYEYTAYQTMSENKEQMNFMNPLLEDDTTLSTFKNDADYYLYDKMSLEETAALIYGDLFENSK
jgi:oligogalacturonide transport system substrate-binding protein